MFWYLLAAFLAVVGVVAGHLLAKGLYGLALLAIVASAIGVVAQERHADSEEGSGAPSALIGGCAPFNVFSQNQFQPYGTLRWTAPEPTAERAPASPRTR